MNKTSMLKSQTEKINEIRSIYLKLRQLGLHKNHPDIQKFQKIVQEYILSEDAFSGKIRIHDANRILCYILPKTNKHTCEVSLKVL